MILRKATTYFISRFLRNPETFIVAVSLMFHSEEANTILTPGFSATSFDLKHFFYAKILVFPREIPVLSISKDPEFK